MNDRGSQITVPVSYMLRQLPQSPHERSRLYDISKTSQILLRTSQAFRPVSFVLRNPLPRPLSRDLHSTLSEHHASNCRVPYIFIPCDRFEYRLSAVNCGRQIS